MARIIAGRKMVPLSVWMEQARHAAPTEDGSKMHCAEPAIMECYCTRCASDSPDERFYACRLHQRQVEEKHLRVRGRVAQFGGIRRV
jgi:hypothetical protein